MEKEESREMKREAQSNFYKRVYDLVGKIPPGTVATYGQIAMLAGSPRAARQVGYAMSAVSENHGLPCHRVVNRLGELAAEEVFGGREFQRLLLEREGVGFLADGRIDMKRFLWDGVETSGI